MTNQEIRDKAPSGATHINQSGYYFRELKGSDCEMYNPYNQEWFKTYISVFDIMKPL